MSKLNIQLIAISGFVVSALFPVTGSTRENFSIYDHSNHNHEGSMHDLKKWKTGSNFTPQNRFKYNTVITKEYDTSKFAQTEPQRRSVNPWKIKQQSNNSFETINAARPWGSVPEKFSTKTAKEKKKTAVSNDVHANQQPKYKPFGNDNLLLNQNRNPNLVPILGNYPTFTDPGGFSPMYSNPGYGYGNGYGYGFPNYRPNLGYLRPFRW
ncbi:MAG: hypothetical protein DIZ80_06240 [endosymbiont of Galathealinum brachiosum]|uniref:Uncharacterized protein n=1 Tax=endosymbiont of Galathealinum brachiosum TaxID=2200906 RepID=A0A370DHD5_9GAMM|nr:MAG: hypothetical protein DIZ80_06240 [endosymbiont of Galathealinum brachiosum]